jgi:hypothetical protein
MEPHNTLTGRSATNARDRRVGSGEIPFRQQFVTWYQVTKPAGAAHEAAGTTDSADYLAAVGEFYNRFPCRIQPWPDYLNESFTQLEADPTVYQKMFGPSEFHCPGTLRDRTVVDRLPATAVPTSYLPVNTTKRNGSRGTRS